MNKYKNIIKQKNNSLKQFLKLQTMTSTENDNFSNQDSNSNKKWQDNIPPTI